MTVFDGIEPPQPTQERDDIAQIAHFNGLDSQLEKLAEECAEVVQAALKFKRNRDATTMAHLAEEIGDAQILMDQIGVLCPEIPEYSRMFRALKIKRELDRIEEQLPKEVCEV